MNVRLIAAGLLFIVFGLLALGPVSSHLATVAAARADTEVGVALFGIGPFLFAGTVIVTGLGIAVAAYWWRHFHG